MNFSYKKRLVNAAMLGLAVTVASTAFAGGPPRTSALNNSVAIILIFIAAVLLLAIGILAYVLTGVAGFYVERLRDKEKTTAAALKTVLVFLLSLTGFDIIAQTSRPAANLNAGEYNNMVELSKETMYALCGVIGFEVIILLAMLLFLRQLLAKDKPAVVVALKEAKEPFYNLWWKKLNNLRSPGEESKLTLEHNYDGIRELDNNLPPWWLYGFYGCIIFSVIYLYRFHVSHSAPSTIEEYEIAMVQAEIEKQAYLATSASNVDENSVKLLTDVSALEEAKKIFTSTCAACHGAEGQGTVGPNLTDDYWLHSGSIKDIFKVIKYGVPEKGMKSWKDDFSPVQIAALASFVKSLHNTKPANPKEAQGDLYNEEAAPAADSTQATDKKLVQK